MTQQTPQEWEDAARAARTYQGFLDDLNAQPNARLKDFYTKRKEEQRAAAISETESACNALLGRI